MKQQSIMWPTRCKTPITSGQSATTNARNDSGNAAEIFCRDSEQTSTLRRPWLPRWTRKLLRPRRTKCTMQRKLARWPWSPCQQGSNTLCLECVLIRENNAGNQQKDKISTRCGATIFREARGTSPDMSGRYLQVKLM